MNALLVAWRATETDLSGWSPVGRLEFEDGVYRFFYTEGARTAPGFRPFSGMEDVEEIYESDELFPLFANRLLSKSRPEYDAFLRWGGFDPGHTPDPIAILGVTEGIRETDSVEVFPCPVPDSGGCYFSRFFLHGVRWKTQEVQRQIGQLRSGEVLYMMLDVQNHVDSRAVALRTASKILVGYAPRYLASDFWKLLSECRSEFVKITVDCVNADAPLQNRVLCRMEACWPDGFRPCSDEKFNPIPKTVSRYCPA